MRAVDGRIEGEVLGNVLDRFAKRGRIISYLVDTDGWLWVKMATAEQATRVAKRMSGVAILQGRVVLAVMQSSALDWPTDLVPALFGSVADRVVPTPDASAWNRRRGRSSQAAHDRFMKFMEKHLVVFETRNAKRGVYICSLQRVCRSAPFAAEI